MRIVVIEDDAVVAETLALYLEQAGYTVAAAKNGIAGLALDFLAVQGLAELDVDVLHFLSLLC